jgi:hypothetical protein
MSNLFNNLSLDDDINEKKMKKNITQKNLSLQDKQPMNTQQLFNKEDALKIIFPHTWNVWIHRNSSKDWSLSSYDRIMSVNNAAEFWNFINNFNKINYMDYQFFMMRNDIKPTWEDPVNYNGGAASIRLKLSDKNLLKIWEDICLYVLCDQICTEITTINGISFNLKNDLVVIKIWNDNINNDISKKINKQLISKYRLFQIVYIKNRPNM